MSMLRLRGRCGRWFMTMALALGLALAGMAGLLGPATASAATAPAQPANHG